ncbi:hypothetical protein [Nostoc sp.]|uniref:hypothetical protein n=1 Tax=Nostoc sp. TaxID=1180 RepID=UPI002D785E7F|nr:hypothetical protein [Nostoc sp.]
MIQKSNRIAIASSIWSESIQEKLGQISYSSEKKSKFALNTLKDPADRIIVRQEGRWIYYRLNLTQFSLLEGYLSEFHNNGVISSVRPGCD